MRSSFEWLCAPFSNEPGKRKTTNVADENIAWGYGFRGHSGDRPQRASPESITTKHEVTWPLFAGRGQEIEIAAFVRLRHMLLEQPGIAAVRPLVRRRRNEQRGAALHLGGVDQKFDRALRHVQADA